MLHRILFFLSLSFLVVAPDYARAQVTQPSVRQVGTITPGNLAVWVSPWAIEDGGAVPSADIQALLDSICDDEGAVLYRAVSDWACLLPGTNGDILTLVAGVPDWATSGGGTGTVTSVGFAAGAGLAFAGTSPVTTNNTGAEATFSIPTNGIVTTMITNANVTYEKIQNVTDERLLGNDSGGAAAPSEIGVTGCIEFDGSDNIQIQSGCLTPGLFDDIAADTILANATASPAAPTAVPLNATLEFSAGELQRAALTGEATATAGSNTTVVEAVNGVDYPASPSADQIPVTDSSSAATYRTVPNCTDAGGNHLNYDQSTNTFSCGTSSSSSSNIVGEVIWYGGTACPTGTLTANGATPSQATYPELYTAFGTTWGSDAGGNFTLPNLTSSARFIRAGTSGTLQGFALEQHDHDSDTGGFIVGTSTNSGDSGSGFRIGTTSSATTGTVNGATTAAETRPINAAMQPCVVYE